METDTAGGSWLARDRALLGSAIVLLVGLALAGVRIGPRDLPDSWWIGAVFVTLAAAVHVARLRAPLPVAGIVAVVLVVEIATTRSVSFGSLVVAGDVAYILGVRVAGRWLDASAVIVGFASGVGLLFLLSNGASPHPLVPLAVTIGVAYSGSVWWGREVRRPRVALQQERARYGAEAEAARARAGEAVAAERLRIARELHDAVAGNVSGIALKTTAVLSASDPTPERLRRSLADTRTIALEALGELQQMIGVLRAGETGGDTIDVVPDLDRVVAAAHSLGVAVAVAADPLEDAPRAVRAAALRIVQEALTNAARHAPGCEVALSVERHDDEVRVLVRNAIPHPTASSGIGTGAGLAGMAERVRSMSGSLSAGADGGDWVVDARLPVTAPGATAPRAGAGATA